LETFSMRESIESFSTTRITVWRACGEERGLDVLLVLVPVADDQRVGIFQKRHHGQQLGLRAGLEAVVVLATASGSPRRRSRPG